MFESIYEWLITLSVGEETPLWEHPLVGLLIVIAVSIIAYYVARIYLLRLITLLVNRTETEWDDIFYQKAVFAKLALIAPALMVILLTPSLLGSNEGIVNWMTKGALAYIVIVGLLTINSFLSA